MIVNLMQFYACVVLNYGDSDILFCYSIEMALPEEGEMAV
jgi:hypothetical protein